MPLIIDDSNYLQLAAEHLQRFGSSGVEPRNYAMSPMGSMPGMQEYTGPLIPRSEWSDRIKEKRERGQLLRTIARNAGKKIKDQARTNYCWAHAPVSAVEHCMILGGQGFVELSATSVAARIKQFRNVGGWGSEACRHMRDRGVNTVAEWPANLIQRKYDTEASRESAKNRRMGEWFDCKPFSFDHLMTMVLLGYPSPVVYMWWQHQVLALDPVEIEPGSFGIDHENSYGVQWGDKGHVVIREGQARPDELIACRSVNIAV